MPLPLYDNANYQLTREAPETIRDFCERKDGLIEAGWELRVPDRGPDGFPYRVIFAGPSEGMRGSAIRLHLAARKNGEVSGDADVKLVAIPPTGDSSVTIFEGKYQEFKDIPDQYAKDAALSAQKRVEALEGYHIRLSVTAPEGSAEPDPTADDSYFEIDVFKFWMNFVA